jgi:hypothetical protein
MILFVITLAPPIWAQESQLETLRATLTPLRTPAKEHPSENWWGAVPELTDVKHQLRDLVESRLSALKENGDEKATASAINAEIEATGLTSSGDHENLIGFLGAIELSRNSGILVLKTSVGILCQYDESAYGYEWVKDHWKRIWETEQLNYSKEKYSPQHIHSIQVWQPFDVKNGQRIEERFILSLGNEWGCASMWHDVYWRVWRIDSSESRLLVDGSHWAYLASGSVIGRVGNNHEYGNTNADVLIEFTQESIDGGVHNREAIRHYVIDKDRVHRIDPVALSPRDFVDEWLRTPWKESADWSNTDKLRPLHEKLKKIHAEFSPTMHCRTPDLWQVTLDAYDYDADNNFESKPSVYFLARWRPPYHFTMMGISSKPWPLCKERDDEADQWRTLFWTQGWR